MSTKKEKLELARAAYALELENYSSEEDSSEEEKEIIEPVKKVKKVKNYSSSDDEEEIIPKKKVKKVPVPVEIVQDTTEIDDLKRQLTEMKMSIPAVSVNKFAKLF